MRKILISGASRGIGNSIAKQLLHDGHEISLGLRNETRWKENNSLNEESNNDRLITCEYDALNRESPKNWIDKTIKEFGGIDTLIHCAGILKKTNFLFNNNEYSDIECQWKTNAIGPWLLTKEAWKYLLLEKEARIIVLVSMSGKRSKGNLAGYSMSKFALMSLCQTMRNVGWEHGIRVTAICPGWVNTEMSKEVKDYSKSNMTQPEDIAKLCSSLLTLSNSCIPFEVCINCNLEVN